MSETLDEGAGAQAAAAAHGDEGIGAVRSLEFAERLAKNAPLALRAIKETALRTSGLPLEDAFRLEHAHVFIDSRGTPVTKYPRYIRWGWVQERLGRRSALRCSQKWCELKARLRTTGSLGEAIKALACTWTDHDNRVLLRHLYDLGYVSRAEIVWDDVIASLRAASHPALQLSNHHVAAPGLSEPELQLRFQRLCAHCMRGSLASLFALFHIPDAPPAPPLPLSPDTVDSADESL